MPTARDPRASPFVLAAAGWPPGVPPHDLGPGTVVILGLALSSGPQARADLQHAAAVSDRRYFMRQFLHPAIDGRWLELTVPAMTRAKQQQQYRITDRGRVALEPYRCAT